MDRPRRQVFPFESERLKHFVDRGAEIARAREVLEPGADTSVPVLLFYGSGGMGKSTLLDKIRVHLCMGGRPEDDPADRAGHVPHTWVDFSLSGAGLTSREAFLLHVVRDLAAYGIKCRRFDLLYHLALELAHIAPVARPSDLSVVADMAENAGTLGAVLAVARRAPRLSWARRRSFRRLGLQEALRWRHPHEALTALAPALVDDINDALREDLRGRPRRCPVFILDGLDWVKEDSGDGALVFEAMAQLCEGLPYCPVFLGARVNSGVLPDDMEAACAGRGIERHEVGVIPADDRHDYRREYLTLRHVPAPSHDAIIEVTGGHALWMGVAADIALRVHEVEHRPAAAADLWGARQEREELLERLLERLPEDDRHLMRVACVCRSFDRASLGEMFGATVTHEVFRRLTALAAVEPVAWGENGEVARWRVHQTVRDLVLVWLQQQGELEQIAAHGAAVAEAAGASGAGDLVYFLALIDVPESLSAAAYMFDYAVREWDRELARQVADGAREGIAAWSAARGERCAIPWQLHLFEGDLARIDGDWSGAAHRFRRARGAAIEVGDRRGLALACGRLGWVHYHQGLYEEALDRYGEALGIWRELGDRTAEARVSVHMGHIHNFHGRPEQALAVYEGSLAAYRILGDERGEGHALCSIAAIHGQRGHYDEALPLLEESLRITRRAGDREGEAHALTNLGNVHRELGQYERAFDAYHRALEVYRALGDRFSEARTLNNMGIVRQLQGRYHEALDLHERSLSMYRRLGHPAGESSALNCMASVHLAQGRHDEALTLYAKSLAISQNLGTGAGKAHLLNNMAAVHQEQGRYDQALALWQESLSILRELGDEHGIGGAIGNIGEAYAARGKYEQALEHYRESLSILRAVGAQHSQAVTLNNMAIAHRQLGHYDQARARYEESLAISRALGEQHDEGRTLVNLGLLSSRLGDLATARQRWQEALAVLDGMGVPEEDRVRELLATLDWLSDLRGEAPSDEADSPPQV